MEGEEPPAGRKKITKQSTGKWGDTPLHFAARTGDVAALKDVISRETDEELGRLLSEQNVAGETALYVAAECGNAEIVEDMINHYDLVNAGIKARNGFDALHIAAKQGDLEVVKLMLEAHPELAMTVDSTNTTALQTAATQGHVDVVTYLLQVQSSLLSITKSNGKTALHGAARNGHSSVVRAILEMEPVMVLKTDKKGQTPLHMAAKGSSVEVVEELVNADRSTVNTVDSKGNTALHIATRKGRSQTVRLLLAKSETETRVVNRYKETALDTAEKFNLAEIAEILRGGGVVRAADIRPPAARELKQTVSDIKHEVHDQLQHTRQTRKRVQGIARRLNKMHAEGLNNAINSTTVVAVLIATVAFAAIFTVPGQYADDPRNLPPGLSLGEANIAPRTPFLMFFLFDSVSLFISLAVVVVQKSVVVIESAAKKRMTAVINKLMWVACVLISAAFLALSFVVVGEREAALAVGVSVVGTVIIAATIGTMCYWVVVHRMERRRKNNCKGSTKRSSISRSKSLSPSENEGFPKNMYAI